MTIGVSEAAVLTPRLTPASRVASLVEDWLSEIPGENLRVMWVTVWGIQALSVTRSHLPFHLHSQPGSSPLSTLGPAGPSIETCVFPEWPLHMLCPLPGRFFRSLP